jgi:hypothetical protein
MAKKLSEKGKLALHKLYGIGEVIAKNRPDVPPTRDELASLGVTKQELKDLEALGLIKSRTMIVTQTFRNLNKTTTGRPVYTITSLGKEVCAQLGFIPPKDESPAPIILPPEASSAPVAEQPKDIVIDSTPQA